MLRSLKDFQGYTVEATDGEIGKVRDVYFDDETRHVRYVVASIGDWLDRHDVLISPWAFKEPTSHSFPVGLTRDQVRNSPAVDTAQPLSRQQEIELHDYFGWPSYWGYVGVSNTLDPASFYPSASELRRIREKVGDLTRQRERDIQDHGYDPHLRSTREVAGYRVRALDGQVGHVEDFILDTDSWTIRYCVVDTRDWLPGRRVLIAASWLSHIDWAQKLIHVDLRREDIEHAPEFDPEQPVNRRYEERLYDYYGRPRYWASEEVEPERSGHA